MRGLRAGEDPRPAGYRQHHPLLADAHRGLRVPPYWEYRGGFFNAKGVAVPVAVSVFPGEQYEAPRSWTERAYSQLLYYHRVDKGGHFAAWEQPELFSAELRAAFRSLRRPQVPEPRR
jgi:pimeloyl-ACP methyl ester carboxylesterase